MTLFQRLFSAQPHSVLAPLAALESLDEAMTLSAAGPIVLYKHSSACGSSLFSRREVEAVAEAFDGPVFEIIVQNDRGMSNEISRRLDVRHETPQVLIVRGGKATHHWSHSAINSVDVLHALQLEDGAAK